MTRMGILCSAVLVLLLGAAPGFAQQDEKHEQQQDRPEQRQGPEKREQNAPGAQQQARPEANRPAQEDRQREQMDRRPQEERQDRRQDENRQQQRQQEMQQQQRDQRNNAQEQRIQENRQDRRDDQRAQEMRGNPSNRRREVAHGRRIPEERFRSTFGREHHFHINRPVIVEGAPQFEYGGYTFVLVDPWPAEWAYTDDFYVDYVDDTYYLYDPFHPGIQIALNIIM
jgi:hypothetical protein